MDVCLCLILAVLVSSTSATPRDRFNNANVGEVIEEPDNPLEEDDVLEPDFLHNNLEDENNREDTDDDSPNDILPPLPENKDFLGRNLGSPGDIKQPKGPLRNNRQNESQNGLRKFGDKPIPPNLSSLLDDIFNEPTRDPERTQIGPSKPPVKPLWHSLNRQSGNTAPLTSKGGPQKDGINPQRNNERPYHHILRSIAPRVKGEAVFAPARDLPPEELHSLIPHKELSRHIANGKIPIFPVQRQNNGSSSRNPKKTVVVPVMLAFDMYVDHENQTAGDLPPGALPPGMVLPPGARPFFKKHSPPIEPMGLPGDLPAPDSDGRRPEPWASEPPLPSTSQNSPNNEPVNPLLSRPSETRPRSSRPPRTNPSGDVQPNINSPSSLNPANDMTNVLKPVSPTPGATNKPISANSPIRGTPNIRPANSPDRRPRPANAPVLAVPSNPGFIQDDPTVTDNVPDSQISSHRPRLNPFGQNSEPLLSSEEPQEDQPLLPTVEDGSNQPSPFNPNKPSTSPFENFPLSGDVSNIPRGPRVPQNGQRGLNPTNQNPPIQQPFQPFPLDDPNPAFRPNQPASFPPDIADPSSTKIRMGPRGPSALNDPRRLNPINQNTLPARPTFPAPQDVSNPALRPNQPSSLNPEFANPLSSNIPNSPRGSQGALNDQRKLNPINQNLPSARPPLPAPQDVPNPSFRPNQPSSSTIQNGSQGPRGLNPFNQNPPGAQPPLPAPQGVQNPALHPKQPPFLNREFANPLSSNIPNSPRDPQGELSNPRRLNPTSQNPASAQPAPQDVPIPALLPNQPSPSNIPNGRQVPRFPHHKPRRLNPYHQTPSGGQPSLPVPLDGPTRPLQQNQPSSLNPELTKPDAFDKLPTTDDIRNGPQNPQNPPNRPRQWNPSNLNPLEHQPSNSPVRDGPNPSSTPNRLSSINPGFMNPSPSAPSPIRRGPNPLFRPNNVPFNNPDFTSPVLSENLSTRSTIPSGPREPGIQPTGPRGLDPSNQNPPVGRQFYPPIQDGPNPAFPAEQPSSLNPDFTNVSPFENLPISSDAPNVPKGPYTPNNGPYELNPPNQNPGDQLLSTNLPTSRDLPNSPHVPLFGPRRLSPSNQIPTIGPQSLPINTILQPNQPPISSPSNQDSKPPFDNQSSRPPTPSKIPKSRRRSAAPEKSPSPDFSNDFPTLENNPESQIINPNLPQPQNPFDTTPTGISRSPPNVILPQDKTIPQIPTEPLVSVNPNNSPPGPGQWLAHVPSEPGNRPNYQTPSIMAPPGVIPSNSNPLGTLGTGPSSGSPVNNPANIPESPSEKLPPSLLAPPMNPGINKNIQNVPQSPSALPSVPTEPSKLTPPVPNGPTTNPDQSNANPTVPSSLSNPPPITPPGGGESPVSPAPPIQSTLGEPVPTLEAKPDDLSNRLSIIPTAPPSGINSLPTDKGTSNAPISIPPLPILPPTVPQKDTGSHPLPSPVSSPVDPISINQIPTESRISPPLQIPSGLSSLSPNNNNVPSPLATSPSWGATTSPGGQDSSLPVQTTLAPEPLSQSVWPRPDPQRSPPPLSPTQMPTVLSANEPPTTASVPLNPTPQNSQSNVQENQPNSPASSIPSGNILPVQPTTLPPSSVNPGSASPTLSPTSPILTPQPSNISTGSVQPTSSGLQPGVPQTTNPAPNQPPSSPTSYSQPVPATTVPQIIPVTPSPTTPSAPATPNPAAGQQALPPQGNPVLTPSPELPVTSKPSQQTLPETSSVTDPSSTSSESVESTPGPNSNPSIPNIAVDPTKAGSPLAPGAAPIVPLTPAPASPAGLPRGSPRPPLGFEGPGCWCPLLAVPVLPVLPVLTGCPACRGTSNATVPAQGAPLSLPLLGLSASPGYFPYRLPLNFSLVNVTSPKNFTTTPQPSPPLPIGLWSYLPASFGIQSLYQPPNLSHTCKCLKQY